VFKNKLNNNGEKTKGDKISATLQKEIGNLTNIQRPKNTNLEQISTDLKNKNDKISELQTNLKDTNISKTDKETFSGQLKTLQTEAKTLEAQQKEAQEYHNKILEQVGKIMEQIAKAQANIKAIEADFNNSGMVTDEQKNALRTYKENLNVVQGALAEMTETHLGQFSDAGQIKDDTKKSIQTMLSSLPNGVQIYIKNNAIKNAISNDDID
jgi:chromosome segregation ATPase